MIETHEKFSQFDIMKEKVLKIDNTSIKDAIVDKVISVVPKPILNYMTPNDVVTTV